MPTLLIVDDEPNVRSALSLALKMEGFEVLLAANAREALAQLEGVDLVLTDLSMPEMDGLGLLLEVRRRRQDLPVAIMTAYASVDSALRAMQEGAYDYLLKPCQTDEILLKVRLGLKLGRYEHELRAANEKLAEQNRRLAELNLELERLATTDGLTQIANRRRFMERLQQECANARRYHHHLSVVLLDIDHFKRVNDGFGHAAGDEVLKAVARVLAERARQTDLAARWGGEEFAVLLPFTRKDGAVELAEDLRVRLERQVLPVIGRVTASLGVAEYDPFAAATSDDVTGERLLAAADEALYRAKAAGRNRVEAA